MGIYGIDFYGTTTYGAPLYLKFDARPFTATPVGYGDLRMEWVNPEGDWDLLRLVRSSYGFPKFPEDGTTVLEQGNEVRTSFFDQEVKEGKFFYYSIFVRATENDSWVRAGDTIGLPTENHGYGQEMFRVMPGFMQESDLERTVYEGEEGPLQKYLGVLGMSLDHVRTEYESLRWLRNPDRISGNLLLPLAEMFGVPHEPSLGMRQARVWLREAVYLYRVKGTRPGVEAAASAITGWGARVSYGRNLFRSDGSHAWHHSSSIEDTTEPDNPQRPSMRVAEPGTWEMSNLPLTWEAPASSSGLDPPWETTPLTWGTLPRTWAGDEPDRDNIPRWFGANVIPLRDYTVSVRVRADEGSPVRQFNWTINWYGEAGEDLGEAIGPPMNTQPGYWTRMITTANSPVGAYFAAVTLHGEGPVHLSRAQFEQGNTYSAYEPASALVINFDPTRWNFIPNPSFESALYGWNSTEGTLDPASTPVGGFGSRSALLDGTMETFKLGLATESVPHTFSAHVEGPTEVSLGIRYFETANAEEEPSSTVFQSFSVGEGVHRLEMSSPAPTGSLFATVSIVTDRPTGVGSTQFEEGSVASDYFDGSFFGADYLWSEVPNTSASKHYPARVERNVRVWNLLPDFLPYGQEFILNYVGGAPASSRVATGDQGNLGVGTYGIMPFGK